MTLQNISFALRAAADVARAGENLLASIDRSRKTSLGPLLFGVALGVGIGALIFQKDARKRVVDWAGVTFARPPATNGVAEPRVVVETSTV
jgi:hypothetical protein